MADNIKEFEITAMISVPAVFEVIYRKLIKGIEKKGKLETVKKGVKVSQALLKLKIDVRKKLFKEIHANLGGKLRLALAGGAALDPQTQKGFNDLGLTEGTLDTIKPDYFSPFLIDFFSGASNSSGTIK